MHKKEPCQEGYILYLDTRSFPLEKYTEINAATINGHNLIVATSNKNSFKGYAIDHIIEVPIADYKEAEKGIIDYISSNQLSVIGVVAWKDREVELASIISEKLGLRCTPSNLVKNVRNKAKTRHILDDISNINPKYAIIYNEDDFKRELKKIGIPAILKPCGNSGGSGIFRVSSEKNSVQEFNNFVNYNKAQSGDMYRYYTDGYLIEEVVEGTEHSVSGIIVDNKIITFTIVDKKIDCSIPFQYQNVIPSAISIESQKQIIELTKKVIYALGINWCGFHLDFILSKDGPKILEVGGRLGGECINSHLIPLSYPNTKPYSILLNSLMDSSTIKNVDYTFKAKRKSGHRIVLPHKFGKIKSIRGLDKVWKNTHVREFVLMHSVGNELVHPMIKPKSFEIAYIIADCALDEDINKVLDEISGYIKVEIE